MRAPAASGRVPGNPLASAMTPMIDVVFLLLVFFLCTATLQPREQDLAASLLVDPVADESGAGSEAPPPELEDVVVVGRHDGDSTSWSVNQGPTVRGARLLAPLLGKLAEIDSSLPVTIDAGPRVPLSDVVAAYDAARSVGFGRVLLTAAAEAAQPPAAELERR